jgi:hypothetical protein
MYKPLNEEPPTADCSNELWVDVNHSTLLFSRDVDAMLLYGLRSAAENWLAASFFSWWWLMSPHTINISSTPTTTTTLLLLLLLNYYYVVPKKGTERISDFPGL